MPVINVLGDDLTFPDSMSESEIADAIEGEYLPSLTAESPAGQRYRAQLLQEQQQALVDSSNLRREQAPGMLETAARGFAQGTTLGFGDEIGAGVSAAVGAGGEGGITDRYKRLRDEQRAENRLARAENPKTYVGGELGGGLATGIAGAGRQVASQTLRQALPRLAKVGAAEGAVGGAGYSESGAIDDPLGLATDVVTGAGVGATLGAAIPAAGQAVGAATRRIMAPLSRDARAARQIRGDISADNLNMDQVQQQLAANPNLVLADLGENLQQRLGAMANMPGATAQAARSSLEARNIAQLDRMTPRFEAALGNRGVLDATRDSIQRTRDAAAPLYEIAYESPIRGTQRLQELMGRPAARAAMTKATRMARDEGVTLETGESNVLLMDYVQRALRDSEQAVRISAPNKARIIGNLRSDIVDEVDRQLVTPEFPQGAWHAARRIAADEFANRDAMELGSRIFRERTPNIREAHTAMSQSEREHFRISIFDSLMDRMGTKSETANLVQDFRKPKIREAMSIAFDDPQLFREFTDSMGDETRMFATMNKALQGSPTASRQAFQDLGVDASLIAGDYLYGSGGPAGLAAAGARRGLTPLAQRLSAPGRARQASAMGDVLLSANPEQQLQQLVRPPRPPTQLGSALPAAGLPATEQILEMLNGGNR